MNTNWKTSSLLGKGFTDRMNEVVLEVGKDRWTRQELIDQLHCANFRAAHMLSEGLRLFQPRSVKELMNRITIYDLMSVEGIGVTAGYVWMCLLEAMGINPLTWLQRGQKKEDHALSLTAYKLRTQKYHEQEIVSAKVTPIRKRA